MQRALRAARAVADAYGLPCEDAVLLPGGSNALVHLKPTPAVARVMTATSMLHDDMESWLAREVAVGQFLGERGLAVAPTSLMPPGPHERDGLWMTVWDYVPHEPGVPGATELGHSLRQLHAALAEFPGELEPLTSIQEWLGRLIETDSLRAELDELTPHVFGSPLPAQPLHGDTGITNVLRTDKGLLWNDLEDVCTGPVEWDVAGLVVSARLRGQSEAFVGEFLDAYDGPQLEELADFIAAHELYTTIWQAAQRSTSRTS
jgi:hypothetical protein